jgi:formate-nitrite transporter family protein
MSPRRQGLLQPPVHEGDHVAGSADAPVTLVEYGDYECPYCYRAHPIVRTLQGQLGAKLRFVFRNFPLSELHPYAEHAAEAAESVGGHAGAAAFWKMHHLIYQHQQDGEDALDGAHLLRYAAEAGADAKQVEMDLDSGIHEERVKADFISGVRSGVNGTPTFFINGARFEGDWTNFREFAAALEAAAHAGHQA